MRRPALFLAILALPAILGGCGSDAKEEAPVAATGDVLAQAPPNAVGANVESPAVTAPPKSTAKDGLPQTKIKPKVTPEPEDSADPEPDPAPPGDEKPKKGTDL